ncbi:hypothetical protein MK489_19000 [Myxococcota bacterium]|nr:hypothetical protein [Myxococcota bacterium]
MRANEWFPWFSFGKPKELFLCESDGFSLNGAIWASDQQEICTSSFVETSPLEPAAAVAEILLRIEEKGFERPRDAYLILPNIAVGIIELPIGSHETRTPDEMNELVRWELDPIAAEQGGLWSLGSVLHGLGYIDDDQRQSLVSLGGPNRVSQFGDLAAGMGIVEQAQLDQAVRLLNALQDIDEELACAWVPLGGGEEPGSSLWLASAIGQKLKSLWLDAFNENGIELEGLYPSVFARSFVVPPEAKGQSVVQVEQRAVTFLRIYDGLTRHIERTYASGENVSTDEIREVLSSTEDNPTDRIWLTTGTNVTNDVADQIQSITNIPIETIENEDTPRQLLGITGAARHASGELPSEICPRIETRPPPVPIYKRPYFPEVSLVVLLFLGLIAGEVHLISSRSVSATAEQSIRNKLARAEATRDIIEEERLASENAEQLLNESRQALDHLKRSHQLLTSEIPERNQLITYFLDSLSRSVSQLVVLDKVSEHEDYTLTIEGWSFTEEAAQEFIRALAVLMSKKDMGLRDEAVIARTGWGGLDGYSLSMSLVPRRPEENSAELSEGSK